MDYDKNQIAGSLLGLRQANGYKLSGQWSVCSFQLEDSSKSDMQVLAAFSEELNTYYLGDQNIASVILDGEYGYIIFFLIPTKYLNECGRHICSFRIIEE